MPYLADNDIKTVFQLGDLFDKRRSIDFLSLAESKRFLFKPLQEAGIAFHTLLGNHDLYYRESLSINSTGLLLGEFDNVHMYDKPTKVMFDDTTIDVIPWICKDNELDTFEFMLNSNSDLCFGHFEIQGFSMQKGMESHDGIRTNIFAKYEKVLSGHFHTRSDKDNILYVGTPYENTYADLNDQKGFHVFDTVTRQIEFIENPYTMFLRHEYNDELIDYGKIDIEQFRQKYIKIIVVKKTDFYKFDQFINKLYDSNIHELKILEDLSDFSEGDIDSESINIENTLDVLENYIDSIADESNKSDIKLFLRTLYLEAQESL
jgi:hypothetical protein